MKKILILVMLLVPAMVFAQEIGNYLILSDIGGYKFRPKPTKKIYGNSGILISAGHFDLDHDDVTYETRYILPEPLLGVEVQVTQHSGSDSDKWLLHEVDKGFRDYYGIPSMSYTPRQIDGQTVLVDAVGGRYYRWLNGNKVIAIEYHGSLTQKPEPLEIVKAYLTKYPSTLSPMNLAQLRSTDNKTKWIKDEMERRLWLCDKWFMALQLGKAEQKDVLEESVKSMQVFLDYREKYYGIKAADEKNLLSNYLMQNNGTGIKAKLAEYKTWWAANKTKAISIP